MGCTHPTPANDKGLVFPLPPRAGEGRDGGQFIEPEIACPAPIPEILITTQRERLFLDHDSPALLCFVFLKTTFSGPKNHR